MPGRSNLRKGSFISRSAQRLQSILLRRSRELKWLHQRLDMQQLQQRQTGHTGNGPEEEWGLTLKGWPPEAPGTHLIIIPALGFAEFPKPFA